MQKQIQALFFSIYTHKILLNKSVKLPEETTQYIYANLFC